MFIPKELICILIGIVICIVGEVTLYFALGWNKEEIEKEKEKETEKLKKTKK